MKSLYKFFVITGAFLFLSGCSEGVGSADSNIRPGTVGQGGSLATFAIANNHLFVLSQDTLSIFGLSNPEKPNFISATFLGFGMETIFPRDNQTLFFGANDGMYIYNIANAPAINLLSMTRHVVACDPVVADQNFAYVTLRSTENRGCRGGVNELQTYDISNIQLPMQVHNVQLSGPIGLALGSDYLYVCDNGIKIFDRTQPNKPTQIFHATNVDAVDIIKGPKSFIVLGRNGISQYEFVNGNFTIMSQL